MSDSARLFVDTKLLLEKAPKQLVIHSPTANNDKLDLPFESSFFNLRAKGLPDRDLLCAREGIRMFTPEAALVKASGGYPWAIVRVEDRVDYLASLEAASVENKVERFVDLIAGRLEAATLDMAARGSAHRAGEKGAGTA